MTVGTLSTAAYIATIATAFLALIAALVAYREWLHKTGHWLYIPAPGSEPDPLKASFWVYPAVALDEEGTVLKPGDPAATRYGVPVSGEIVNAGPSDAFSVRIFAEPELRGRFAGAVLDHTVSRFSETLSTQAMEDAFLTDYRAKDFYFPLLKAGDSKRFFVVVEFAPGDRFLNQLLKFEEERGVDESLPWEDERGQAHRVNAASRTAIGRRLRFKAGDLCAPFESEQDLREWRDRATA